MQNLFKRWDNEDVELLKENYNALSNKDLQNLFPNKSFIAIYKKAYKLGLRKEEKISKINRANGRKYEHKPIVVSSKGYKMIYMPEHHRANSNGRVMEHIVVWENANGKKVPNGFCVHHLNENKSDNRPSNLCLLSNAEHTILHHTGKQRARETKQKISDWAKKRLQNPKNHPLYKEIDILQMKKEIENGETVKNVCEKYHINKTTYYTKLKKGDYANV